MNFRTAALLAPLAAALAFVASSCSDAKPGVKADAGQKLSKQTFPPVKDANLELEMVTPQTEFFRGDVAPSVTFRLKNEGLKPVSVYEWMAKEPDNLRIRYVKLEGSGKSLPPETEWALFEPKLKDPVARSPLDLYPRNAALISVELSFLKDACASSSSQGRSVYAMTAELNLSSVSAKTKPFRITLK